MDDREAKEVQRETTDRRIRAAQITNAHRAHHASPRAPCFTVAGVWLICSHFDTTIAACRVQHSDAKWK